jgi:hypothetical protein
MSYGGNTAILNLSAVGYFVKQIKEFDRPFGDNGAKVRGVNIDVCREGRDFCLQVLYEHPVYGKKIGGIVTPDPRCLDEKTKGDLEAILIQKGAKTIFPG